MRPTSSSAPWCPPEVNWMFAAVFVSEAVFFPFVWKPVIVSVGEVFCVAVGSFWLWGGCLCGGWCAVGCESAGDDFF